jgi:hypothetical protein
MNVQMERMRPSEPLGFTERPSVEEWVLAALQSRGTQTLDQLGASLPETNWAQLFLAVDRLSRAGLVSLRPADRGDYEVALNPTHLTAA